MQKHQQRPELRDQATHTTDVQAAALARQELAHVHSRELAELQLAAPPLAIFQEHARDALAPGDGPWRKPPLKQQVLAVVDEQTIDRAHRDPRPRGHDADRAQILQRQPQARRRHPLSTASGPAPDQMLLDATSIEIAGRQALAVEPLAEVPQLPQAIADRPPADSPPRKPRLVAGGEPCQRTFHPRGQPPRSHRTPPDD
jgi:hypothetical protein